MDRLDGGEKGPQSWLGHRVAGHRAHSRQQGFWIGDSGAPLVRCLGAPAVVELQTPRNVSTLQDSGLPDKTDQGSR